MNNAITLEGQAANCLDIILLFLLKAFFKFEINFKTEVRFEQKAISRDVSQTVTYETR